MAQLPVRFDATQVEPAAPLETIPAGDYNVTITGSEMKPTAAQDGSYCALELTVMDGEFAGRKLFDNLNLVNKNQTAVEIAYRTLSAICHAVGVFNVADTQELHGRPLAVKVGIQQAGKGKDGNDYEARNVVRGYKAIEGAAAASPAAAPAWAGQAAPAVAAPAPAPAPAPVAAAAPMKRMTEKAAGATYEQFIGNGWTDDQMVAEGYLVIEQPAPPPSATPPWAAAPGAPAAPAAASFPQPSAASTQAPPPWAK